MKLSSATSVLLNYSIQDAVSILAAIGFEGVDIWGGRPHVYRDDYTEAELLDLRKSIQQENMVIPSFMPAFFRYPHSLSSPNDKVRRESIDYMFRCADNASILGAKVLLVVPGRSLYGQGVEDAFQRLLDSVNQVCDYCTQYNLKLGIESANQAVTNLVVSYKDALKIITEIDHPSLGVVLDSGHLYLNREDFAEVVQNLGDLILQFHVNDNDGEHQQNLIPGDGTYDFHKFINTLDDYSYNGFLSVELGWEYTIDPEPALKKSLERLQGMLMKIQEENPGKTKSQALKPSLDKADESD
jgi:protein FrlC